MTFQHSNSIFFPKFKKVIESKNINLSQCNIYKLHYKSTSVSSISISNRKLTINSQNFIFAMVL